MKKILKYILYLLLAIIIVLTVSVLSNWTYLERLFTYPVATEVTSSDWYQPKENVPGNFTEPLPVANPDSIRISESALQKVANYAETKNSASLLVLHHGEIILEKYWRGQAANSTTNAMSMAKTLVSLALGIAIEEGYITSENEPVATYIPEFAEDGRSKITIKHLLYMASGLRLDDDQNNIFSDLLQLYGGTDVERLALRVPAVKRPGEGYEYNNINSQLLAMIVERATGKRLAAYISEKIWQPLGAKDAAYWLDREGGMIKSFCCFFTTGRDWLRLGQMLMKKGKVGERQIIPENWLEKMLVASPDEPDYGYQIWLAFYENGRRQKHRSEPFIARDMFYLDGRAIQRVYIIPSYQLVIVRTGENVHRWDDSLVPNTLIRGINKR